VFFVSFVVHMNILIVKLSALGDVVQSIPAFEALRNHYSSAHITWLVEEEVVCANVTMI
jgi:ADP-heptose:LPS heptosyltransferase